MTRSHSCTASALLEQFAELYGETPLWGSMVEPGQKLWREYWKYSGRHMILTDEGWEPGAVLDSYVEGLLEGENIQDVVRDEVNWIAGDMKYPRIFSVRRPAGWRKKSRRR